MKRLLSLMVLCCLVFVACGNDDSVDDSRPTPEVPEPDKITLSQQTVEVGFEPDTYSVSVTSPCSWDAFSKNDWIIVESKTGIAGTEQLSFRVARNEEERVRKGTIVVKNNDYNFITELYVTQTAFIPEMSITPKTLSFPAIGGEISVAVMANFQHTATTNAGWLTIAKTAEGYIIQATVNPEFEERTAEIMISNEKYGFLEKIQITQSINENYIVVYTSIDNNVVEPHSPSVFGVDIISNRYQNGRGTIVFDGEVTIIGDYAFTDCGRLTSVTLPESVITIGSSAFEYCSSLTSIMIPDGVTTIGDWAFRRCALTNVTIPNSVTSIGTGAFYGCSSLIGVTIPDSVTTIGDFVFSGCSGLMEFNGQFASEDGRCLIVDGVLNSFAPAGLTEYNIPYAVTKIGRYAFADCWSLTSVTIPNSVTTVGFGAFWSCSSLTSVYCKATTPPNAQTDFYGDWVAFDYNAPGRKIYVPTASVEAYKSAEGWSEYASAIVGYNFE